MNNQQIGKVRHSKTIFAQEYNSFHFTETCSLCIIRVNTNSIPKYLIYSSSSYLKLRNQEKVTNSRFTLKWQGRK